MSMLNELLGQIQSEPVAQVHRGKRVLLPQKAQVLLTVIEHCHFTLV